MGRSSVHGLSGAHGQHGISGRGVCVATDSCVLVCAMFINLAYLCVQVMLWFENVQEQCFGWPSSAMQVRTSARIGAWAYESCIRRCLYNHMYTDDFLSL